MKKINILLCTALISGINILFAQPRPKTYHTTFANSYNTTYGVVGDIGYDVKSPILAAKPYSIFSSGLWFGGIEREVGLVKTATTTYHSNGYDFVAGPLELNKNEAERTVLAKQYDKIWVVTATEILQHQEDFKDGKIDNPIPTIMAWPAKGNPDFEIFNFFKNDYNTQDLAPFKDVNKDGIYTPLQGDYPFIAQADEMHQPDEIFWSIFNDHSRHTHSKGTPLFLEIHQTGWTFNCSNDPILNNTNFLSFKVLNKGKTILDSLIMGYWADFDLGCPKDDYMGCSPSNNTFFTYNNGDFDGGISNICPNPIALFKQKGVPVSSISFLNKPLYSFMGFSNSIGTQPQWATAPVNVPDFYHYLNAVWRDGTPVTRGGIGYNPNSSDFTKFMFDGNPNDSSAWSMKAIDLFNVDIKGTGAIYLGSLAPNESVTFDIALTIHHDTSKTTTAAQIDYMYANLPKLQNAYNQGFKNHCAIVICQNDCIFPGDANNDGRADERDFLTIAQHLNKKGKARDGSIFWEGKTNENWAEKTNLGVNLKHTDCDGNGMIEETQDKAILFENFLKTHTNFQNQPDVILDNKEIVFAIKTGLDSLNISNLAQSLVMILHPNLADNNAFAYSFELDFDTRFFKSITTSSKGNFWKIIDKNKVGNIHFASSQIGKQGLFFAFSDDVINKKKVPSQCTELRFKNIQAVRADGSIIPNIGATDVKFCFNQQLVKVVENKEDLEDLLVYPNPFNDLLILENKNVQIVDYQLFDIQGKILDTGKVDAESRIELASDYLPKGIYLLKISNKEKLFTIKKVVKVE